MKPRTRWAVVTLATLLGVAVTLSLGRWQLQRAADKQALQAHMQAQSTRQYVDTAALLNSHDTSTLLQQHALLRGHWVANQTVYLDTRQMQAKVGFFVLTPLLLEGSQQAIVVQRGWIARNFEERSRLLPIDTPAGLVMVPGRIAPPPSTIYEPGQSAPAAIRQNLALEQYRVQTGLPLLPVILVQTGAPSEGLLRDWPAVNLGVEKHYGYALQWFGIALLLALLYLWYQFFKPYFYRPKKAPPHA
ncbi:MAG: SURF1 family protein [Rhodoferax sp.]|nr:SURF1 family protein [Rhodoferax sp.]